MSDWTQGYVTEVEYTQGFYKELAPAHLEFAALLQGYEAPSTAKPFNWIEVGCGHGVTANVLAAANPSGKFYAMDFNPLHVLSGRELASAAGLNNIEFFEKSFEEAMTLDLPPMDYFILHGVYSWISQANRKHIVALIRKLLKPGGLVYVSYNCLPGWSGKAPVRKLMTEYAKRHGASIAQRFVAARDFAKAMKESECGYFNMHPTAVQLVNQLSAQSSNYLIHEYLNDAWELLYHSDVVAEMHDAKATYMCSATLNENADNANIPANLRPLVTQETDPVMRELIKDFATNRQFRRDIFARGARRLSGSELIARVSAVRICLTISPEKCTPQIRVPLGEATLQLEFYHPIIDALTKGAQSVAALTQAVNKPLPDVLNTLLLMAGAGYVQPLLTEPDQSGKSVNRFNAEQLKRAVHGKNISILAARNLGNGMGLGLIESLFLSAYNAKAHDPAAWVQEILVRTNRAPLDNDKAITEHSDMLSHLRKFENDFKKMLPMLKTWGVL
ncbi:MAG: methyltransferase regulatory domain-containing protein [Betaproteobacteria bacterium]|nr:methyltransferase regulatory domain-containing protein [Betaproteobacteria bacterium]